MNAGLFGHILGGLTLVVLSRSRFIDEFGRKQGMYKLLTSSRLEELMNFNTNNRVEHGSVTMFWFEINGN